MEKLHIAAGIMVVERKLITVRTADHKAFIAPGGSIEKGETKKQAAVRELKEELDVDVEEDDLIYHDTYRAEAATQPGRLVVMELFTVTKWRGTPKPSNEVTEMYLADSSDLGCGKFGSIFEKDVIPELKAMDKID